MTLDQTITQIFLENQDLVKAEFRGLYLTLDRTKNTFSLTRAGVAPSKLDIEIVEAILFTLRIKVSKEPLRFTKGIYHVARFTYTHEARQAQLFSVPVGGMEYYE